MIVFQKEGIRFALRFLIFGLKSLLAFQKSKSNEKVSCFSFLNASLVTVLQLFKVKLTDGFVI
jgi:hypothetical protein